MSESANAAGKLPQEERNRIVLGSLIAWISQSSACVLSRNEATSLLKVLDGMEPPSFIGLEHKVEVGPSNG